MRSVSSKAACCAGCRHFRQHYVAWWDGFIAADCGHCFASGRPKTRKPGSPACMRWEARPADAWPGGTDQ